MSIIGTFDILVHKNERSSRQSKRTAQVENQANVVVDIGRDVDGGGSDWVICGGCCGISG